MIIRHREWGDNKIIHDAKTVEEFIEKVINETKDKEKKYFRICTKEYLDGKGNMLLYFQDGKLKSHHSTLCKFDYKDVLEYEIWPRYSVNLLKAENIISIEFDNIEERDSDLERRKKSHRLYKIDINRTLESEEEKIYRLYDEKILLENVYDGKFKDGDLEKIVQILVERNSKNKDHIRSLNSLVNEMYEEINVLKAKIEWLDK